MRGIEQLPGGMLSDDVAGLLENSSNLSASAPSIPNPDDTLPAIIDCQHFEHLLTLPVHKSSSKSSEHHTKNKKSHSSSNTISLSGEEINIRNDDVNFNTNMELSVDVDDENCIVFTQMEDEGLLQYKQLQSSQPTQELQLIPMENIDVRVDCSHHFKTDKVFRTREEILRWAKLQGRQSGCVLTIKKAQEARNGRAPRLYLRCERGGKYKYDGSSPKGLRKSGTKKCACPFELRTTWSSSGEKEWKAKVLVINGIHNHQLLKFTEGHPHAGYAGRLTKKELGIVANMAKARIRPREILRALRKNDPGNCTSLQQIYNAMQAMKTKDMDEKSPMQNSPKELSDNRETTSSQNEVLNEIGNLSTASALEPSDAVETTEKPIQFDSDAISLAERVRRLEKFVGLGGSAENSIEIVSDAFSLPERIKRLENIVGIRDSAENSSHTLNHSEPSSSGS